MPGRKRSDIKNSTNGHKAAATLPGRAVRRSASTGREYRQALCPVCGVAHGYKRIKATMQAGGEMNALVNYWEWLTDRERELGYEDKPPFGVTQEIGRHKGSKAGINNSGHFEPDDDPDGFFPLVKDRLLLVVQRWIARGWLTDAEIKAVMSKTV